MLLDSAALTDLISLSALAPLHHPPALAVIDACRQAFGERPWRYGVVRLAVNGNTNADAMGGGRCISENGSRVEA
jgi:hypothetical protein